MIVPFPPGGTTDVVSRIMAERMKTSLGQPIILENVSDANGSTGVGRAARAIPGGYTIDMGQWATHVVNGAIYALRYNLVTDFDPIAAICTIPLVLYARKTMRGSDLKEMTTWLKANPDKVTHANASAGLHAMAALFQKQTGTRLQFVPYRGEAPAAQDLIAGQIDLMWNSPNSLTQVRAGLIKAYVVAPKTRLAIAPNIPTAEETGMPELSVFSWYGLFAPNGTPKSVISILNSAAVDSGNMANFARGFTLPNPSAVISDVSFSCLDHGLV
jgi:tripartite-type tricarboxylate transporter receptor subunit TctC